MTLNRYKFQQIGVRSHISPELLFDSSVLYYKSNISLSCMQNIDLCLVV